MREIRIYQPGEYTLGDEVVLSPEASQHVGLVLRMRERDSLTLFSGNNKEYAAIIVAVKKKQVIVQVASETETSRESPIRIHLAQSISKGDRMELVMQKAVELGVSAITPIISEFCSVKLDKERLQKKCQQWQSIAIAACEQSGRNMVPVVHQPLAFDAFLQQATSPLKLIVHPYLAKTWRELSLNQSEMTVLIGPEGGFSDSEINNAIASGFQALSLGPRILRTETAAIAASSLLQAVAGDF